MVGHHTTMIGKIMFIAHDFISPPPPPPRLLPRLGYKYVQGLSLGGTPI